MSMSQGLHALLYFGNKDWRGVIDAYASDPHLRTKDLITLGMSYCYLGRFLECYHLLSRHNVLDEIRREAAQNSFIRFIPDCANIFATLPFDTETASTKTVRRLSDSEFPECDIGRAYAQAMESKDHEAVSRVAAQISGMLASTDRKTQALGYFSYGETYFQGHNYAKALEYYLRAIKLEPQNALYWGFAGQCSHRMLSFRLLKGETIQKYQMHFVLSSSLSEHAARLDPDYPKWPFQQSLVLHLLSIICDNNFLHEARQLAGLAYLKCKPGQQDVRSAIVMHISGMEQLAKQK